MAPEHDPYYRRDLALAHHLGYGFHADACAPDRFIRQITVFMRNDDGSWRRDDERHDNVLIDTARVPGLLAGEGIDVTVTSAFGAEQLPAGLAVLIGRAPDHPAL
jgi:hypothetical protein